jgi:hypothetical protein
MITVSTSARERIDTYFQNRDVSPIRIYYDVGG